MNRLANRVLKFAAVAACAWGAAALNPAVADWALTVVNDGVNPSDGVTPLGTVSPDSGTVYADGATATLTATPAEGSTFGRWLGTDVPAGHETDNPLVITMDAAKKVTAYFVTDWIYSGGKLKDGYWTLSASGAADAITVGAPSGNWAGGYLDLAKPISGGGAFVALVDKFLMNNAYVEELILPENTLRKVGTNAFGNENNKLKWIRPFLPDSVEEIGDGICRKATGIKNDVFAFRGGKKMGGSLHFESNNGSLKEIILGEGVRKIPDNAFKGISGLTNVVIGSSVTNIGIGAFYNCTKINRFTPFLPVGIQYLGTDIFRKCGTPPSATLVIDNGDKDVNISYSSSSYTFESNYSISNIVFGMGVSSIPGRFLSSSGGRKLVEVTFKGNTTWDSASFPSCEAYNSRFIVSKMLSDWNFTSYTTGKMTPWDSVSTANQNKYWTKFGSGATQPLGLTTIAPANVWIVAENLPSDPSENAVLTVTDSVLVPGVQPVYGVTRDFFAAGSPAVMTAPESGEFEGKVYDCVGYKLEKFVDGVWTLVEEKDTNVCAYTPDAANSLKVTWKWMIAGYALTTVNDGVSPSDGTTPLGTVDVTPPDLGDLYRKNAKVTFTATPAAGSTFGRWLGADVPAGHETDNPLEITMDAPKKVTAYFAADWVYSGGKLKDGYWTLAASGATDAIVVGVPSVNWAGGYLDLSKPISGGGAFVELVEKFLRNNAYVEELILPENTIMKIGTNAFGNENSKLKWIRPFLPDSVEEIGEGICRKSTALNNPTFAFRGGKKMAGNLHFESNNGSLKEIILGEGVRMIPASSFKGVPSVTNVVIGNAVTNIGNSAFESCSGVTHFEPFLPVGIQYLGTDVFRKCGTQPNATFVVDNGKSDIAFASQAHFFESYSSVSNMIVGAGVTALPNNFLSGSRKLDEVMFKGFTTWQGSTFATCDANKSRFLVSKHSDDWRTWYSNAANVKPWAEVCATDTAATNTYYQKWGATAKRPVGLTVNAPANVWIVATTLPGEHPGFKLLLQ